MCEINIQVRFWGYIITIIKQKSWLFDFYTKKKWQKWKSKTIKSILLSRKSLRLKINEYACTYNNYQSTKMIPKSTT